VEFPRNARPRRRTDAARCRCARRARVEPLRRRAPRRACMAKTAQAGIPLCREGETSVIAGLLVESLDEFRRSARFGCLPFGEAIADAKPAGPLATYPGDDSWTEQLFTDGVVLAGDAAGFNNRSSVKAYRSPYATRAPCATCWAGTTGRASHSRRTPKSAWNACGACVRRRCSCRRRSRTTATTARSDGPGSSTCSRTSRSCMLMGVMGGPEVGPPEACDGRLLAAMQTT